MDEIKDIIQNVIQGLSGKKESEQQKLSSLWDRIASGKNRQHTSISGYRDHVLTINVDSSAWLYQMNIMKGQLLAEIRKEDPDVEKISFRIGKVK